MTRESAAPATVDAVGLALAGGFVGWALLSALLRGGSPTDYVATIGLLAACYLMGRLTARWAWIVAVGVGSVFAAWVLITPGAFDGAPLAGPLHYANANAALAVQVAAVLVVAATRTRPTIGRLLLLAASVPVLSMAGFNQSVAALAGGAAVFVVGLIVVVLRPRRSLLAVVACGLVLSLALVAQVLIATGTGDRTAARAVSERRVALWTDAVHLARAEPITGFGPQSFATHSPTASDPDTRAAHSAVLQVAAELGFVGAGLLLLLVAWAYWALSQAGGGPAIVGAVAWTAFCLQALIDYVANFPLVVAAAGVVLGLAVGPYRNRLRSGAHVRQNSSMSPSVSDQPASAGG